MNALRGPWGALVLALGTLLLSGCPEPCEDLALRCGQCGDANYKQSCSEVVNRNNEAACAIELKTFELFCTDDGAGAGGAGSGPCLNGLTLCQGQCVDLLASKDFCGSCTNACGEN